MKKNKDDEILLNAIGKIIRHERIHRAGKFTIFCYENDVAKTSMYMLEHAKNKALVTTLFRIVRLLGMTCEEFGRELDKLLPPDLYKDLDDMQ